MNPWDYGAVCLVLGVFTIYHIQYYAAIITKGSASNTALSTNVKIALAWIKKHKEKPDAPNVTLAIQTLRNTILIATFIGGNSLTFGFNYSLSYTSILGDQALELQRIVVSACLLCSFLCWACVIRYASHVGYYIGTISYDEEKRLKDINKPKLEKVDLEKKKEEALSLITISTTIVEMDNKPQPPPGHQVVNDIESNPAEVTKKRKEVDPMKQCANMIALILIFFNLGFRFMFIALPFAFFVMGPIALVVASGVLLAFLYFYDYGVSYSFFVQDEMDLVTL